MIWTLKLLDLGGGTCQSGRKSLDSELPALHIPHFQIKHFYQLPLVWARNFTQIYPISFAPPVICCVPSAHSKVQSGVPTALHINAREQGHQYRANPPLFWVVQTYRCTLPPREKRGKNKARKLLGSPSKQN